jgi:hypothetical protein
LQKKKKKNQWEMKNMLLKPGLKFFLLQGQYNNYIVHGKRKFKKIPSMPKKHMKKLSYSSTILE